MANGDNPKKQKGILEEVPLEERLKEVIQDVPIDETAAPTKRQEETIVPETPPADSEKKYREKLKKQVKEEQGKSEWEKQVEDGLKALEQQKRMFKKEPETKINIGDTPKETLRFGSETSTTAVQPIYKSDSDLVDRYRDAVNNMYSKYVHRDKITSESFVGEELVIDKYETLAKDVENSAKQFNELEKKFKDAFSEYIEVGHNSDGEETYYFKKNLGKDFAEKFKREFEAPVKAAYNKYMSSYEAYDKFMKDNSNSFLKDEEIKELDIIRKYGNPLAKKEVDRVDALAIARSKLLDFGTGKEGTSTSWWSNNMKDVFALKEIIANYQRKAPDLGTIGVTDVFKEAVKGFWDNTIGIIDDLNLMFAPDSDYRSLKFDSWLDKVIAPNDKQIRNLYRSMRQDITSPQYSDEFSRFAQETANQVGVMGAFVLSMSMTGGLSRLGKLAVESDKIAETMKIGRFLKESLTNPNLFSSPVFQTYLRNGMAGMIMTYPKAFNEARDNFEKVPVKDRTWIDYTALIAEPILRASLEGMSETVGAHFLGAALQKGLLRSLWHPSAVMRNFNNLLFGQFAAEQIGEVMEERIANLIDYTKFAVTGEFTSNDGTKINNLGDLIVDQAKRSIYEFAMFTGSSAFYTHVLGKAANIGGLPNLAAKTIIEFKEKQFVKFLEQKYPELAKHAPELFQTIIKQGFVTNPKEGFDKNYERILDKVMSHGYIQGTTNPEEVAKEIVTNNLKGEKLDRLLKRKRVETVFAETQEAFNTLSKYNPEFNVDLGEMDIDQIVELSKKAETVLESPNMSDSDRSKVEQLLEKQSEAWRENSIRSQASLTENGFTVKDFFDYHFKDNYNKSSYNQETEQVTHLKEDGVSFEEIFNKAKRYTDKKMFDPDVENFVLQKAKELGFKVSLIDGYDKRTAFVSLDKGKNITNNIWISEDRDLSPGAIKKVLIHEALHKIIEHELYNNPDFKSKILQLAQEYKTRYVNILTSDERYAVGLTDKFKKDDHLIATEFVSLIFQNKNSAKLLNETGININKSFWGRLKELLSTVLPFLKKHNTYDSFKEFILNRDYGYELASEEEQGQEVMEAPQELSPTESFTKALMTPESNIIYVDVETTGRSTENDDVIQIGAIKTFNGKVSGKFSVLLRTDKDLGLSTEVHGITKQKLDESGVSRKVALRKFLDFVGDNPVFVGHNITFDIAFLFNNINRELNEGMPYEDAVDTLEVAKTVYPNEQDYTLEKLSESLGLGTFQTHDALSDAEAAFTLSNRMLKDIQAKFPPSLENTSEDTFFVNQEEAKMTLETVLGGSELKKKESLKENEEVFYESDKNIDFSLTGLNSIGVNIFRTREDLYNFLKVKNASLEDFLRKVDEAIESLPDEMRQRAKQFLQEMDEEYIKNSANTTAFLQKLYYDSKQLEKIDYLVVEQTNESGVSVFDANYIIKNPTTSFEDAYGKNKSIVARRPLYYDLLNRLEQKGIKLKIFNISHFTKTTLDGETFSTTSPVVFSPAASKKDNPLTVLQNRLFREGLVLIPTGGSENLVIDITDVSFREQDGTWEKLSFEPYVQGFKKDYLNSLMNAISAELLYQSEVEKGNVDAPKPKHILSSALRRLFNTEEGIKVLSTPMSEISPLPDNAIWQDMTLLDFLEGYRSLVKADDKLNLDPRLSQQTYIDKTDKKEKQFATHDIFHSIVTNIVSAFVYKDLYLDQIFNTKNMSDEELAKRSTSLNGNSTKAVLTEEVKEILQNNTEEGHGVWQEGDNIKVRYAVLDPDSIPDEVVSEMGLQDKKSFLDGTSFMSHFANKMLFALNRTFVYKQGVVSKFKTLTEDGHLIKNGTHRTNRWKKNGVNKESALTEFMRINSIGEVHLKTAIKTSPETAVQEYVTWDDIVNRKIINQSKKTSSRNLNDSAWIQDGRSTKRSIGGFLPVLIRTFVGDILSTSDKIIDQHKSNINQFNIEIKELLDNPDKLSEKVWDFASNNSFDSSTKRNIIRDMYNGKHPFISFVPYIMDYFIAGEMTKNIRELFRFNQRKAAYPALHPDGGILSGFKDYLLDSGQIVNEEVDKYFTKNGFLKEGYAIVGKDIFDSLRLEKDGKAFAVMVPPAGLQDIKPIRVIGYFRGNAGIVMNAKQLQSVSGKDYDFDQILFTKVDNQNYDAVWDEISSLKLEDVYSRAKEAFEEVPPHVVNEWKSKLGKDIPNSLVKMLSLFGQSGLEGGIQFHNPKSYQQFFALMFGSFIGKVYNSAVYLSAASADEHPSLFYSEETGELLGLGYDWEFADKVTIKKEISLKNKNPKEFDKEFLYRIGLLAQITHDALDWMSNFNIIMYDFTIPKLVKAYLKSDELTDEEAELVSAYLEERYNPILASIQDNKVEFNSLSEMFWNLDNALTKKHETIPNTSNSFLYKYIEQLKNIDIDKVAASFPKDPESDSMDKYITAGLNHFLLRVSGEQRRTFAQIKEQGKFDSFIHNNLSLINRLVFASQRESDSFSPLENLSAIWYFARKVKSTIAADYVMSLIREGKFLVRPNSDLSPVLVSLSSKVKGRVEGQKPVFSGNGEMLLFFTENNNFYVTNYHVTNGNVTSKETALASVYFEQNPEKVARVFVPKGEEKPSETSNGELASLLIFEKLISIPTTEPGRRIALDLAEKHFRGLLQKPTFKAMDKYSKSKLVISLFGALDVAKPFKRSKKEDDIDAIIKETDVVEKTIEEETASVYQSFNETKTYGLQIKGFGSKIARYYPSEVIPVESKEEDVIQKKKSGKRELTTEQLERDKRVRKEITTSKTLTIEKVEGKSKIVSKDIEAKKYYLPRQKKFSIYSNSFNFLAVAAELDETGEMRDLRDRIITGFEELAKKANDLRPIDIRHVFMSPVPQSKEQEIESIKALIKNNVKSELTDKEITNLIADLFNIKAIEEQETGVPFDIEKYLQDLIIETTKKRKTPNGLFARARNWIFGIKFPTNRAYEIFGRRNILLTPSSRFYFQVDGNRNWIDSNFIASLLDRYLRVGDADFFSAAQISWAMQTQLHYAFEDLDSSYTQHFSEMIQILSEITKDSEKGKDIIYSPNVQASIYNLTNALPNLFSEEGIQFKDNGAVELNGKSFLIANTRDEFITGAGVNYKREIVDGKFKYSVRNPAKETNYRTSTSVEFDEAFGQVSEFFNSSELERLFKEIEGIIDIPIKEKYLSDFYNIDIPITEQAKKSDQETIKNIEKVITQGAIMSYYISDILFIQSARRHVSDLRFAIEEAKRMKNQNKRDEALSTLRKQEKKAFNALKSHDTMKKQGGLIMPIVFQDKKKEIEAIADIRALEMIKKENDLRIIKGQDLLTVEQMKKMKVEFKAEALKEVKKSKIKTRNVLGGSDISSLLEDKANVSLVQGNLKTLDILLSRAKATNNYYRSQIIKAYQLIYGENLDTETPFIEKLLGKNNSIVTNSMFTETPLPFNKVRKKIGISFMQSMSKSELSTEFLEQLGLELTSLIKDKENIGYATFKSEQLREALEKLRFFGYNINLSNRQIAKDSKVKALIFHWIVENMKDNNKGASTLYNFLFGSEKASPKVDKDIEEIINKYMSDDLTIFEIAERSLMSLLKYVSNLQAEEEIAIYQEDTGNSDFKRKVYGHVEDYNSSSITISIPSKIGQSPKAIPKTSISSLSSLEGFTTVDKVFRFLRNYLYLSAPSINYYMRHYISLVSTLINRARDISLLSFLNSTYSMRNYIGGLLNLHAYMGEINPARVFSNRQNREELVQQYENILKNPNAVKDPDLRRFYQNLRKNASMVLGGFEKVMGRFSGVVNNIGETKYTKDFVEIKTALKKEFDSNIRQINEFINTPDEKLTGYSPKKLSAVLKKISNLYVAYGIFNLPFAVFLGTRHKYTSAYSAERLLRFMTMAIGAHTYLQQTGYDETTMSFEGKNAAKDYMDKLIFGRLQRLMQNTQFQYIPGLFLSSIDSSPTGRALLTQYSHYGNSLEHVYWKSVRNSIRQADRMGISLINLLSYPKYIEYKAMVNTDITLSESRFKEISSAALKKEKSPTLITTAEDNEFKKFVRLSLFSISTILLRRGLNLFGKSFAFVFAGNMMWNAIVNLFFPAFATSITIPTMHLVVGLAKYAVLLLLDDDDEEDKIKQMEKEKTDSDYWVEMPFIEKFKSFKDWTNLKKLFLGSTYTEFSYEKLEYVRNAYGNEMEVFLNKHLLWRAYHRQMMEDMVRYGVPTAGVGEQQLLSLVIELATHSIDATYEETEELAMFNLKKALFPTLPGVSQIERYTNPSLFPKVGIFNEMTSRINELQKAKNKGYTKMFEYEPKTLEQAESEYDVSKQMDNYYEEMEKNLHIPKSEVQDKKERKAYVEALKKRRKEEEYKKFKQKVKIYKQQNKKSQ